MRPEPKARDLLVIARRILCDACGWQLSTFFV
jgi:hypothetical protein